MRRLPRVLIALVGFAVALLVPVTSASAAPYANPLTVGTNAQSYAPHSPVGISGTDATPGGTVTFSILGESAVLGSTTADPSGNYSASITLPAGLCGAQTIVAHDLATGRTATTNITINCTSPQSGSGGLSSTGVAVAGIGGVAVLLLLVGGLFLLLGRRRRKAQV